MFNIFKGLVMTEQKLSRMKKSECTLFDILGFSPEYEWTVDGKYVTAVNDKVVFVRPFVNGVLGGQVTIPHSECKNMMKYKNSKRDTNTNIYGDD